MAIPLVSSHLGINIGAAEAERLRNGYRIFYQKAPEDGGRTLKSAYLQTLRRFFKVGLELRGNTMTEVLRRLTSYPHLISS